MYYIFYNQLLILNQKINRKRGESQIKIIKIIPIQDHVSSKFKIQDFKSIN